VLRLINIVQPDALVVGQKDYQQMILLGRLIEDLHVPVELVRGAIVRDTDGLALSSRNQYLTADERRIAPELHATLQELAVQCDGATESFKTFRPAALERLLGLGFKPDYLELRAAGDLAPLAAADGPCVLLVAAWLGRTRLLDNILI
jgi:pantoate--beta-alanine ligase